MLIFAPKAILMRKDNVIDKLRSVAVSVIPQGGKVILYGSRARGDAKNNSDWDLLVLLDKDALVQTDYDNVSYPFVLLGCELGEEINPILYTNKEWEKYKVTPFYQNVKREGINLIA